MESKMSSPVESTRNWANQRQIYVEYFDEIESTNQLARDNALTEPAPFVLYLAAHQNAGRGRGQNQWLDTGSGESLLSTWSLEMQAPAQPICSPRVGLALFRSVKKAWPGLKWALKAPNDLLLDGKKVSGLLLESVHSGPNNRLMVGLGFNILNHPRRLENATHLADHIGPDVQDETWFRFLDEWKSELGFALLDGQSQTLKKEICDELRDALNLNPGLPEAIVEVSEVGDIRLTTRSIRWMDL